VAGLSLGSSNKVHGFGDRISLKMDWEHFKLANRYAWREGGGWKGQLLHLVFLLSFLEVLAAILYKPLQWIGFNLKEAPPPLWLTVFCAAVLLAFSPIGQYFLNLYHAFRLPRNWKDLN
jgi:hypothetical protein